MTEGGGGSKDDFDAPTEVPARPSRPGSEADPLGDDTLPPGSPAPKVDAPADTLRSAAPVHADGHADTHLRSGPLPEPAAHVARAEAEPVFEDTLVRSGPVPSAGPAPVGLSVTHEHEGRYAGEEEVGRGGLGRVAATYDRHLARQVAKKELLTAQDPKVNLPSGSQSQAVSRFLREARVTAQLEHPNIVPVYELGRKASGALYYTMKLVRGRTLKRAIADARDLQDRLSLLSHFVDLCQAIAYAHSRGVIHRDIKPDNVMIGEFGETLVLDWGVAKLRGSEDLRGEELARAVAKLRDEEGVETLPGSAFGTPVYMAPEQADGRIEDVDERSDVWALGVVLYQLLSGRVPYPSTHVLAVLVKASRADLLPLDEVCVEPPPPELAAIVKRALAPDKADRYESAKALADDVEAFQRGARVGAHEYSAREVLARWVAEHRAAVTVSVVAAALLLLVLAGAYVSLREERDRALAAEAASNAHFAEALVERARAHEREHDWVGVELLAAESLAHAENPAARGLLVEAQEGLRPELVWSERTYAGCASLAFAELAEALFCGTSFGVARFEAAEGQQGVRLEMPGGWVRGLAVSADGQRLLAGGDGAEVVLYEVDGGVVGRRGLGSPVRAATFWPDREAGASSPVVVLERGAVVRLRGPKLEPEVLYEVSEPVALAAASPGAVAFADRFGHVARHDGARLERIEPGHGSALSALAVSERGDRLATAGQDRSVRLFDAKGRALGPVRDRGLGVVTALAFAGRALLAGTEDGEIAVLDLERRRVQARFVAHEGPVDRVQPVTGGLVSSGRDRAVRRYRGELPSPRVTLEQRLLGSARGLALAADGGQVALAGQWGLALLTEDGPSTVSESPFEAVGISSDGHYIAAGGANGAVSWRVLDEEGARWTDVEPIAAPIAALAFDAAAERLFAVGRTGELVVVALASREVRALAPRAPESPTALAAAGAWIAVAAGERVELRADGGRVQARLSDFEAAVTALAIDPKAHLLATGDADGELRLYDLLTLELRARMSALRGGARALAFTAEGPIATLDARGALRLYDLAVLDADPRRLLKDLEVRRGARLDGTRPVPQ